MKKVSISHLITLCYLLIAITVAGNSQGQHHHARHTRPAPEARQQMTIWVDSVMNTLSMDQKIGQLLVVRVPSKMKPKAETAFRSMVKDYGVGGVCFFSGNAATQLALTRKLQREAPLPLFVCIDGEWGLGMRLKDGYSYPRQMMMGALSPDNDSIITAIARQIGIECHRMGINVNFAPVVDLNSNPQNPVIGSRSFGEDRRRVATKGICYMRGLQGAGVMAVAKHFPGHGDTDVDSHIDVPVIRHAQNYIDSVDLYPFRRMIGAGCRGVMVGHLLVPQLDPHNIASLSEPIVTELLRSQLRFNGLIFTDGMEMKAVTKQYTAGEAELRALKAGCDILLLPDDVKATLTCIKTAAMADSNLQALIDNKCRRVLREKYRLGMHHLNTGDLSTPTPSDLKRDEELTKLLATKALTLVCNQRNLLPLQQGERVTHIALGNSDTAITAITDAVASRLAKAQKVVIHLYANANPTSRKNYGVSDLSLDLIKQITAFNANTILVVYGSPFIMQYFPEAVTMASRPNNESRHPIERHPSAATTTAFSTTPAAIVVAYQNLPEVHQAVQAALWGKTAFEGILPIDLRHFDTLTAATTATIPYVSPYAKIAQIGWDTTCFVRIDSLLTDGIKQHAYPGCQLLIAYQGNVVYRQQYGRQTYDKRSPRVDTNTVYDLASLTKITATTLAVMKLVDAGKVSLDDPLSRYLPYLKHTNKSHISIRQALSHIARLKAFEPYWKTVDADCLNASLPNIRPTDSHCDDCRTAILKAVAQSELTKHRNKYLYSDLGFMLLGDMVRVVSGQSLDLFLQQQFYQPLQMHSTTFCPLLAGMDSTRIAPTETNSDSRQRTLRGEVHDPNAAAMGGVAGHAGLFSTADDLFRLCQMLLNGGTLDGHRYLSNGVINTFTTRHYEQYGNRRALGFDRPLIQGHSSHVSPLASPNSYGHTGFTGTMIWIDPNNELVYIFLSNRVYPTSSPNLLAKLNIRTDVQQLIYQAMGLR